MFPVVNDMTLVVYGIATFAATVGYAYSHRRSMSESRPITHDDSLSTTGSKDRDQKDEDAAGKSLNVAPSNVEDKRHEVSIQSPSLKRKRTRDDEHEDSSTAEYPQNLEVIYPPKKRSRTPSSESEYNSQEVLVEVLPSPTPTEAHEDPVDTLENSGSPSDVNSPVATPPPITPEQSPRIANEQLSTPPPRVVFGSSATMSSPLPKSLQPSQRSFTSNAFSAFVGSPSFSTPSPKPGNLKPAWSEPNLVRDLKEEPDSIAEEGTLSHVLVAAATSEATEVEHLTGEENEDVEQEIKGVKLFVKRGDKPFSDGMQGHLKLLSDKTTMDERLLFRREPLWQVSLNIRLHPSIRCTFDANENVLRIIVTEPVEKKDEREVVIYALKPGRSCSKQDFEEFAEALLKSPGLKAKTES